MGEKIDGSYIPDADEQREAEGQMTDEQRTLSWERERELGKHLLPREKTVELMADWTARNPKAELRAHRPEPYGGHEGFAPEAGYNRDERLWISDDGRILKRMSIQPIDDGYPYDTGKMAENTETEKELTPEKAIAELNNSISTAEGAIAKRQSEIDSYREHVQNWIQFKEKIEKLKG